MPQCPRRIFAPLLLLVAACGFAQNPARPAPETTPPAPADLSSADKKAPEQVDRKPVDLRPDAAGVVPAEQIRELLLHAEDNDFANDKRQRDYTYIEREERHKFDGHGALKKIESRTSDVLEIYGEPVERLTAKDDRPLSSDEAKKEEEKIQKIIDKRKNESEDARRKRLQNEEKEREENRKFVLEAADAFNFRLVGSELIDGHDSWVLEGEPRPGYQPKAKYAGMLRYFKGRVWIDKAEEQWVKLDVMVTDTISWGFVLARFHKGTHAVVEMTEVNHEVWLPKHVQFHVDVRLALFKGIAEDIEQTYHDYKKFRTDTKITVVGEDSR